MTYFMESFGLTHMYTPFEKDWRLMMESHRQEMESINHEFDIQLAMGVPFMEKKKEKDPVPVKKPEEINTPTVTTTKKPNIFTRIFTSIKNFIDKVTDSLFNLANKENLDMNAYSQSGTFQVRVNQDVQKIDAAVDQELLKGRKVIQKIASKTGYPDDMVAEYIDNGSRVLGAIGPSIVDQGLYSYFRGTIKHKMKKKRKVIEEEESFINQGYEDLDPKQQKQIHKVLNHMNHLVQVSSESLKSVFTGKKEKGKKSSKNVEAPAETPKETKQGGVTKNGFYTMPRRDRT